jgi:hypothetical protein
MLPSNILLDLIFLLVVITEERWTLDNTQNTDDLLGLNMPRGNYAISGTDWQIEVGEGAPMIINGNGPGIGFDSLEADNWIEQYGASYDSFLSIVDGQVIQDSIDNNQLTPPYKNSMPSTRVDNIWEYIGEYQQIQYVVSGETIDDGAAAVETFGPVEDARGIAIRLPIMGVGYGRSIEMLEIFEDDKKMDRLSWNAGSIDVRWDDKRKTWAAYNDLIADHEGAELGTAVFSTNPDDAEGFPLLKGRLQDVWWVRQPLDLDGSDGKTDGAVTAKIMTHLEHEFYDDEENGFAALNTAFIVPHKSLPPPGTPDVCFTQNEENVLGSETTAESDGIAILTEVGFWFDAIKYGPIKFGASTSELGEKICCTNSNSKLFVGEMVFVDESVPDCDDEARDVGAEEDNCVWVPAVRIDECELVGAHFEVFFNNDRKVAEAAHGVCMSVYGWSLNLIQEILGNDALLKDGIECNNDEIKKLAAAIISIIQAQAQARAIMEQTIYTNVQNAFNQLVANINTAFLECIDCEANIPVPQVWLNDMTVVVPIGVDIDDCKVGLGSVNPFDCQECVPIELEAPCSKNQSEGPFKVGLPCAGSSILNAPDYDNVGSCQTHTGA